MTKNTDKKRSFWRLVAFDSLAGLCFIGVILFGWLPGPGGIPLFLAGLGFLAVNHDWAERWLETAKHKGVSFKKYLFPDKPLVRYAYDFGSAIVVIAASYLFFTTNNKYIAGACIPAICFALFVFLVNRDRLDKISNLFKKK